MRLSPQARARLIPDASWNMEQAVNYFYSGDILIGPEEPGMVSIEPALIGITTPNQEREEEGLQDGPQEVQVPEDEVADDPAEPQPGPAPIDPDQVDLRRVDIRHLMVHDWPTLRTMQLPPLERAAVDKLWRKEVERQRKALDLEKMRVHQTEGMPTRSNPGGLRSFLLKDKKPKTPKK